MANDLKPHIGIFGRRNNGKSSIINFLVGQEVAIVSEQAGTTTDPVKKAMEVPGVGPCIFIDTAGIDDIGLLGQQRIDKTKQIISEIDCAILVVTNNIFGQPEMETITKFREFSLPFFIIHNKSDFVPLNEKLKNDLKEELGVEVVGLSVKELSCGISLPELMETLKRTLPESAYRKPSLLEGLVKPGDSVLLVCPIDREAPEGRLILPQVMTIRDALDNGCICTVIKETDLRHYLENHGKPDLVITDSQVFGLVSNLVSADVPLTSFSIIMARMRGDFEHYVEGTPHLSKLDDGDKVLILESCTHLNSCDDIGRVKLPKLIRKFTGKDIVFDYVSGLSPIGNIGQYAMAIQCGGCMATRKQLINRTNIAVQANIPISNYGMAIAYMNGIFERSLAPFRKPKTM